MTLLLTTFAALYALWVVFLAVINLKRVSELGQFLGLAKVLGLPIIMIGYILVELTQELTVSARLERHNRGKGWRKAVATWFEPLLDPFDPSGNHI
jgi:drug/metabolite transporter (DMT)-like permease